MKRISAAAYQALRDSLAAVTWNKRPFERLLRDALRDHPELLVGLDFGAPKRDTADALVDALVAREASYQQVTIELMIEIADMTRFPNIEQMAEPEDRSIRLRQASDAVGRLRTLVAPYRELVDARRTAATVREAYAGKQARLRTLADDIDAIRVRYLALLGDTDPHRRGKDLELLLSDLFVLFDMEPHLSYSLEREQIDGSLSFDTDDYIVEARWRAERTSRESLDVFKAKVERKGRNALGLFVSINNFTSDALREYDSASPFVAFTGEDVFLVLEGRIGLDALLRAKKRHVNDTGSCYLSARRLLSE